MSKITGARSGLERDGAILSGGFLIGGRVILRSRFVRVAALVFQALWLNVVVPGHTRGVVRTPGDTCPNCAALLACQSHSHSAGRPDGSPAGDPSAHCAICQFAAMLCIPPAIDLAPPKLGFLELRDVIAADHVVSHRFLLPYHGRAPPASCALLV